MTPTLRIDPVRTALLVIDVQERLWAVMDAAERAAVAKHIGILGALASRLHLPTVLSEQNPRGLGPTVPEIAAAFPDARRLEKMEFSCVSAASFAPVFEELARPTWIVCGMETHVCVYLTARDLAARGVTVHVPVDAVLSRTARNKQVGLDLIRTAGGVLTSTETVVFDALAVSGTDDFRALSRLVK